MSIVHVITIHNCIEQIHHNLNFILQLMDIYIVSRFLLSQNSAAMNIHACVFWCICARLCLDRFLGEKRWDHRFRESSNLLENAKLFCKVVVPI